MSSNRPYRETAAQELTFEILEEKGYFDGVDVKDWDALKKRLQSIKKINLWGFSKVSDISIVGEMNNLEELSFNNTAVAEISWAKLLPKLKLIRFNATPVRGLEALAGLEELAEIRANQCKRLTPEDIKAICHLPSKSLVELHLRRTSEKLDPVLRRMKEKYPRLRIEYDWSTRR